MTIFRSLPNLEARLELLKTQIWCPAGPAKLKPLTNGTDSEIYHLQWPGEPDYVVKLPPLSRIEDEVAFESGIQKILREMGILQRLYGNMFANEAVVVQHIFGIPLIIYRKRDLNLRAIIGDGFSTDAFTRIAILFMVSRGLINAEKSRIILHQDLKPENILLDFMSRSYTGDVLLPVIPKIHDFELSNIILRDKFRGYRPYLPAEAYEPAIAIAPDNRFDVFSLAVIAHELLTDGYHPMGVHMSKYVTEFEKPFHRDTHWKAWARTRKIFSTDIPSIRDEVLAGVLFQAFDPDPQQRPTLHELNEAFALAAGRVDVTRWDRTEEAIAIMEGQYRDQAVSYDRFCDAASVILERHWVRPDDTRFYW